MQKENKKWWIDPENERLASSEMLHHRADILDFFDTESARVVPLPPSYWDKESFTLVTKKVNLHPEGEHIFSNKNLNQTKYFRRRFSIAWNIKFQMHDSEDLCSPENDWDMWFVYPENFPESDPTITFRDFDFYRTPHHPASRGQIDTLDGERYELACYSDKEVRGLPHHKIAYKGILWLRANLHAAKHNETHMPEYVIEK